MISKTIAWSLNNRMIVLLCSVMLLVWGVIETYKMPVDVFPDLTAPSVTIVTEALGMAPTEVEKLITFPIETLLNGASGVRRVRSSTGVGLSVVTVEFDWGMNIYKARQIVSEKLQSVRGSLPPEITPPKLAPITSVMGEIMFVALKSDRHTSIELKTISEWTIRRRLLAVQGVAEVISNGGDIKQYQIIVQPSHLAKNKVTLNQVVRAMRNTNLNTSAGFYKRGGQEYLIEGIGRVKNIKDIEATVILLRNNYPILIKDIAKVKIGPAPKRGIASHNGENSVVIGIQKQPDANTLALTTKLDKILLDIQSDLPKGMVIHTNIFRQANFISVSIKNLTHALRDGAILVVLIVFVFLVSGRATAITLVAVPLSLVIAILLLSALGATINTMTLGGMAIALGALVDDAIIVVENVVRRLRENRSLEEVQTRSAIRVVYDATLEIQGSIVFATLIIMLVFLPIFFLSGVESRLMQPLGLAYVISLAASLLVAITVTPILCSLFLPKDKLILTRQEPKYIVWIKARYTTILHATVKRWKTLSIASGIILVLAMIALMMAGRSFLPEFNEGSLTISAVTLPGTSLEQSDKLGRMVEKTLLNHPEVVATARRTGRAERDPHAQGIHASEIEVTLKMKDRGKEELLKALRKDFRIFQGMNIVIGQPISHRIDHMLSGTRANIAIKVFGVELKEMRRLAKKISGLVKQIPGAVDIAVEQQVDIPFLRIKFKPKAIARYGLTIKEVANAVKIAFSGQTVSKVYVDDAIFDIVVKYNRRVLKSLRTIEDTLIITRSGALLPIKSLASIYKSLGPNTISRENVQRKIVVMVNVAGRDLISVVSDINNIIKNEMQFPKGYYYQMGGQFESASEATQKLLLFGLVVIIFIYVFLFVAFHSSRDALLVMINLPLALIGGVLGLYLSGGILSIATIVGFITLFGIATRNGVMLIAHIHTLQRMDNVKSRIDAVMQGSMERLVPILMTALAAGLALIPLAMSGGEPGSEIQAPMAIVILFGLLTSTVLNMIVLPSLYLRFGSFQTVSVKKFLDT